MAVESSIAARDSGGREAGSMAGGISRFLYVPEFDCLVNFAVVCFVNFQI